MLRRTLLLLLMVSLVTFVTETKALAGYTILNNESEFLHSDNGTPGNTADDYDHFKITAIVQSDPAHLAPSIKVKVKDPGDGTWVTFYQNTIPIDKLTTIEVPVTTQSFCGHSDTGYETRVELYQGIPPGLVDALEDTAEHP